MSLNLLIVESPKKAKTIQKLLPKNWIVKASFGHFRELAKDGENKLGFEIVGNRVICRYVPINSKAITQCQAKPDRYFKRTKAVSQDSIKSYIGD